MAVRDRCSVVVDGVGFDAWLYRRPDDSWLRCEQQLDRAGVWLPVCHRHAWASAGTGERWLLGVRREGGCEAALGLEARCPRSLPGHRIVRADMVGIAGGEALALRACLQGLRRLVVERSRVLAIEVALCSRDRALRERLREDLTSMGFTVSATPSSYQRTSVLDLSSAEDALLAGLHPTARRNLRLVKRAPVRLAPVEDPARAHEMSALIAETRARTGGPVPDRPLGAAIELARQRPDWLRVMGLFHEPDDRLLAFAVGHREGDRVRYADAASTRRTELKIPLGYAPLWDLVCWARTGGASWFDLGGITDGTRQSDDPLGGISDFKRYFRGAEIDIGEELGFEALPLRSRAVALAHRLAEVGRRGLRRARSAMHQARQNASVGTK